MIYLDTHVLVWLYAADIERFSLVARDLLGQEELLVSPIVQLELTYLKETGRITVESTLIMEYLRQSVGLVVCDLPFERVLLESIRQDWTRDPFDRLIVAQALTRDASVLSKDRSMQANYPKTVW